MGDSVFIFRRVFRLRAIYDLEGQIIYLLFSFDDLKQAVEAMDRNRVCTEYWNSRPLIAQHSQLEGGVRTAEDQYGQSNRQCPPVGFDTVLRGLFMKANPEELHTLYSILNDNSRATGDGGLVSRLLSEEIHKRPR